MGTCSRGTTEDILAVVGELHAVPFEQGIPRVYTVLKLDERRDRPDQTLADKVRSVEDRLRGRRARLAQRGVTLQKAARPAVLEAQNRHGLHGGTPSGRVGERPGDHSEAARRRKRTTDGAGPAGPSVRGGWRWRSGAWCRSPARRTRSRGSPEALAVGGHEAPDPRVAAVERDVGGVVDVVGERPGHLADERRVETVAREDRLGEPGGARLLHEWPASEGSPEKKRTPGGGCCARIAAMAAPKLRSPDW